MPETLENAYEYFKATREQRGLSIADIANVLHLNVTVIEQIEAGDFSSRRFAPVFMRGYIRSYAKYLQLPDEITQKIVSSLDITDMPPTIIQKIQTTHEKKPSIKHIKKVVTYIVVVIALMMIASFWHSLNKPVIQTADNGATQEAAKLPVETTEIAPSTINQENTSIATEEETTPSTENIAETPTQEETPALETIPETAVTPEENSASVTAPLPPVVKTPAKPAVPPANSTSTTPVIDAQETP